MPNRLNWLEKEGFALFDAYFGPGEQLNGRLEQARDLIDSTGASSGYAATFWADNDALASAQQQHFESDWIGANSFFPGVDGDALMKDLRVAIHDAATRSLDAGGLPLEMLWVKHPGEGDVRVGVAPGPNSVTIVISSPVPERVTAS